MRTMKKLVLTLLSSLLFTAPVAAQSWPSKPIRFVNTFPAGGPTDILARAVGELMQKQLGQTIITENKAGAGGNLAAAEVAKLPGDGYAWLWAIDTTFTTNPHIYPSLPFKPADLKPLVLISSSGLLLGVSQGSSIKSVAELLAAAKSKPLSFASGSNGSPGHMGIELLNDAAGLQIAHIPYRGNAPAVMAIVGNEVTGGVLATTGMLPQVKAGKITPLAVTSSKRSSILPDVPTTAEAGLKGLEKEVIYVVMVPASTPETLMQSMQTALINVLNTPEMRKRLSELDMVYEGLTGAAAAKRLNDLSTKYARIAKQTGMKPE